MGAACIVFVMKPPRPPVQALVDSRSVIFCDELSGEAETKLYSMRVVNPKKFAILDEKEAATVKAAGMKRQVILFLKYEKQ